VKERSRARGWALQALYAWESRGGGEEMLVPVLEELYSQLRVSQRNRLYADALLRLVSRNLPALDTLVQQHLTNWNLNRLSVIDRNILRLGVTELLYVDDVPPRVTIREMIRLAERYSTPESPRFVNGVLDAVMRHLERGEAATAR
jgi:transcription antitermination protein NusB